MTGARLALRTAPGTAAAILLALVLLAAVLAAPPASGRLLDLDLGTRPVTGAQAITSVASREVAVVEALTCRDELRFLELLEGPGVTRGAWPLAHLFAKAAYISDHSYSSLQRGSGCLTIDGDVQSWREYLQAHDIDSGAAPLYELLNAVYVQRFGLACSRAFGLFGNNDGVTVGLTPECLAAQIGTVLRQRRLGQWEFEDDGSKLFVNPGTDGLPCVTEFAFGNREGIKGDWDMSVVHYTRLAYFLHEAVAIRPSLRFVPLGGDLPYGGPPGAAPPPQLPTGQIMSDALRKLDQFLLSLRGPPTDETYNVVITCGNPDNHYGGAQDYVDGNDVYDEAEGQEPRSTGEDLWKWLRFLLLILLILASIVTLGAVAAIAAGAAAVAAAIVAAGVAAAVVVAAVVVIATLLEGIEETENHLLMINSSKYLKNKLMMAELDNAGDTERFETVEEETEEVREWLLERLEDIVEEDFVEYNSKPYGHWSMTGLLNLRDFACEVSWDSGVADFPSQAALPCHARDRALATAVDALLDLHSAKAALGSQQGRRIVPFRRLVEENYKYWTNWLENGVNQPPKRVLNMGAGGDHMVGALQFWTGSTQHAENGRASVASLEYMVWHATSGYRPHELILDLALNKSTFYEQTITHEGYERYVSGPGWMITAGGDSTHEAQGFRLALGWTWHWPAKDNDKGVGVPTTLMAAGRTPPIARRDTYRDFLRFEGARENWSDIMISFSDNRCVTEGFACGLRLEIPPQVQECARPGGELGLSFIDSSTCPEYVDGDGDIANDFYVAIYEGTCHARREQPECNEQGWGFIEVVQKPAFVSVDAYAQAYIAANRAYFRTWNASYGQQEIEFVSVGYGGRTLEFTPEDEDFGADCRACGGVINHESDARLTIRHPARAGRIFIDLTDEDAPVRRGEGGVTICGTVGEHCFEGP